MEDVKWGELIAVKTLTGWKVAEYKKDHDKDGKYLFGGKLYSTYRKATLEEVEDYIRSLEKKLERAERQRSKLRPSNWGKPLEWLEDYTCRK